MRAKSQTVSKVCPASIALISKELLKMDLAVRQALVAKEVCAQQRLAMEAHKVLGVVRELGVAEGLLRRSHWLLAVGAQLVSFRASVRLVFKDGERKDPTVCDELARYLAFFGGNLNDVAEAYKLSSAELAESFKNHRRLVGKHHESAPQVYAKKDYLGFKDSQHRLAYVNHLNSKFDRFSELQERGKANVVPVVQGRSENAAWWIANTGFGYSPTLDPGYYGSGLFVFAILRFPFLFSSHFRVFLLFGNRNLLYDQSTLCFELW